MKRIQIIFLLVSLIVTTSWAQEPEKKDLKGELESVEIEIVKERQITLPKANRLFEKIPPRPAEPIKPEITYDFQSFKFSTPEINPTLRPLKLKAEQPGQVNRGYVSAGYGNFASPYLEAFISNKSDKNKLIGAHGYLNQSGKGPVDGKNSGSGYSGLSVFGQTFGKEITVKAKAAYENRFTHFYGYNEATPVSRDTLKQSFNQLSLNLGLTNARNSDFAYTLGGEFSYLTDAFSATESMVDLNFESSYKFSEDNSAALKAQYVLFSRKDEGIEAKPRSLFQVSGGYVFKTENNLRLHIGAIVALENDTIDSKNFHFFPDVRVTYPLSPAVDVVGSLTGGIEAVSLHTLSRENMWLAPAIPLYHTNKVFDLQAGVRARLGSKVLAGAGLSFASLKNLYFFINNEDDQSKFDVAYDDGSTKRTNLYGSITYNHADNVRIMLRGDLFSYSTDKLKEAYHRPGYKFTTNAAVNIYKKIVLSADIIAMGNMKALVDRTTLESITLDPAFDLNLKSEYIVSPKVSVFAEFNNITSSEYPVFLKYPVRGFQVMGGFTWSF